MDYGLSTFLQYASLAALPLTTFFSEQFYDPEVVFKPQVYALLVLVDIQITPHCFC
jgi:hypothetical protein